VAHESHLQKFYSKNISEGGIFLEMDEFIPIGNEVALAFAIPGVKKALKVTAKVVRHHKMSRMDEEFNQQEIKGVGLSFINVNNDDRKLIEQYITGKGLAVQG
jgi:Tfp pilus assembly protein PilZ